jgi:hypothetical protein
VGGEQRRLTPPLDARQPRSGLARSDALERMTDDAQVDDVLARSKQRRRQRHELGPSAIAGHRLDHAAADEDQGAVEVTWTLLHARSM